MAPADGAILSPDEVRQYLLSVPNIDRDHIEDALAHPRGVYVADPMGDGKAVSIFRQPDGRYLFSVDSHVAKALREVKAQPMGKSVRHSGPRLTCTTCGPVRQDEVTRRCPECGLTFAAKRSDPAMRCRVCRGVDEEIR